MTTLRDQLKQAIFGQGSSHGKADTSQENYAGARGPMPVARSTFDGLKNKGLIPANWDHANPEHSKQAGFNLIDRLADKFQDDPRKVAAAYYAGEKAVRKDGSIADFRDLKNPKAPTTHQYIDQVVGRMGMKVDPVSQAVVTPSAERYDISGWRDTAMPGREDKVTTGSLKGEKESEQVAPSDTFTVLQGNQYEQSIDEAEAQQRAASQEREASGFLDKAGTSLFHNGMVGALLKSNFLNEGFERVPGYNPRIADKQMYEGKTEDEQILLDEAISPDHAKRLAWSIDEHREAQRQIGLSGPYLGFAAQIVGGLPEGAISGIGASMGTVKAMQLAGVAMRTRAAAVGASATENIAGNLAMTAAQDYYDPYVGVGDYALALGLGAAVTAPALKFSSAVHEVQSLSGKVVSGAIDHIEQVRAKAVAGLPADATPEQIAAEMGRVEATSIRDDIQGALAPLGRDRQLLPDMETAEIEVQAMAGKEFDDLPSIDMDWTPPVNTVTGKPINDPATVMLGNAGMVSPWNAQSPESLAQSRLLPANRKLIEDHLNGYKLEEADALGKGVHVHDKNIADVPPDAIEILTWLHETFLPDTSLFLRANDIKDTDLGSALNSGVNQGSIKINFSDKAWRSTLIHEFGHILLNQKYRQVTPELRQQMKDFHNKWMREYVGKDIPKQFDQQGFVLDREVVAMKRSPLDMAERLGWGNVTEPKGQAASLFDILSGYVGRDGNPQIPKAVKMKAGREYWPNFDEMGAEQFGKYIEAAFAGEGPWRPLDVPKTLLNYLKDVWKTLTSMFQFAKTRGLLQADESFQSFYESVRKEARASKTKRLRASAGLDPYRSSSGAPANATANASLKAEATSRISAHDPIAEKYGLELLPQDTPAQRAEANAILYLYRKADEWAQTNPIDEARLKSLTDNNVFNAASTSLLMLKSKNPVVRMIASELLESPSGAAGRRSTAALSKYLNDHEFMGNSINELQSHYTTWRNSQGGNVVGDFWDGNLWKKFNRLVAEQIESRRAGGTPVSAPDEVMKAATMLEQSYDRMRLAQVQSKTNGWAALPESSVGYMPHKMSPEKVRNMTLAQEKVLHSALVDQFVSIEGFDISFSANLASKYIDRVKRRALGGFDAPMHLHQTGAADIVEDALTASGLSRDEVKATMQRFRQGAASHTKKRLNLDLMAPHDGGEGSVFRLMDLYETDQLRLLRSQAQRVSGEVALSRHGIKGKPGLAILREAMKFGEDGSKVEIKELEAFDQVSAEFLGEPFGKQGGKWLDRATQFNSLARLGGMGFTQMAEVINAIPAIGLARAASSVLSMKRLRDEAKALSRGEKVDNGILKSIEAYGGAEFGTDSYKMVFPFDNGDLQYQTYGSDSITFADRALRGGSYLQGKLSFWRSIHAAQQRGMAEQIVHKAVRYIREGDTDTALADMGIDPIMAKYMQGELSNIAKFDGDRLIEFDITKVRDPQMAEAFVQAVHRGTSQIIQGTFIGETGKWAHDGLLRMMTQFRSFGITSIEKQWARQVNNYGLASYLGIILGSMSLAAPIYYARTLLAAAGKPEQEREEYLKKQTSFGQMARASMNYVAGTGLAGDMLDALTAVTGVGQVTGGRTAAGSQFVGNVIAPAAGLADDLWRGIQNTKEGTDPHDLLKAMPFSRLPGALPVIDALSND